MKIKKFKKKVYLIPVAVCILGILLLGYYFFMDSFSKVEETTYVYIIPALGAKCKSKCEKNVEE